MPAFDIVLMNERRLRFNMLPQTALVQFFGQVQWRRSMPAAATAMRRPAAAARPRRRLVGDATQRDLHHVPGREWNVQIRFGANCGKLLSVRLFLNLNYSIKI